MKDKNKDNFKKEEVMVSCVSTIGLHNCRAYRNFTRAREKKNFKALIIIILSLKDNILYHVSDLEELGVT